ncbi:MAG TPA: hypothetical protein VK166_13305, partial [Chitinophagaceae bacterium]|nr:hypothetical protein [Chitinophagaceae bacterium]
MKSIFSLLMSVMLCGSAFSQNTYYVNDNSTVGDVFTTAVGSDINPGSAAAPYATLVKAFATAQNGDIIYVDAGTFAAGITISRSVSIKGANYNINPNATDPNLVNPARNAESILTGTLIIGADNIVIKGFRISSPGQAIVSNNSDWKNSTIENNLIDVNTTGSPAVLFRGASLNPIQSSGHSITNNRFLRTTENGGGMLVLSKCADIIVRGNSFIQTGATLRSFNAIIVENTPVENTLIEGNYFRDVNRAMQIFSGKNLTIRQNKLETVGRGIQLLYGALPMQHINIDGNYIKDDKGTQPILLRRDNTNAGVEDINIQNNVIEQNVADYGGGGGMIELELIPNVVHGTINVLNNKVTISGDYTTALAASNQGIFISGNHNLTNIRNNEINFTAFNWRAPEGSPNFYPPVPTGIFFMTDGGTQSTGLPFSGAISSTSEFNVENNIINGFKNSIAFYDPLSDTEGGLTAFKGYGQLTAGAQVFIQYNSFLNDEIAVNNGEESFDVSAQCNWWGVYKVQDMLSRFSLGTVSPLPWLTDGTDTDPSTTGFQPADGICTGAAPVVVLDGSSNITCNGAANGSAQISATGGFGPFQFKWTKEGDADFVSTEEDPANFGPGIYHLAVTDTYGGTLYLDANGDLHTIDVTITEPDAISASFNSTNIACYGSNNGSASIEASGGTGTLTYLWSNGETTTSVSGLQPGNISVEVKDENGCVISKSTTITQPNAPLSVTLTGTSASCNGSVTATAVGGTAPYTYLWSNGATTSSISNVPAGTYNIIVTDANSCTTNGSLTITGNATLNPSVQITDLTCAGSNNGVITVTNANGISPFEYNINGGAFQPSNTFGNLAAGTYIVGVKDAGGCSDFVTKTVLEPAPLLVSLDRVLPPCYGAADGRIFILVSGGTGSMSFSWTGPGGFTSTAQNPSKLVAGDYHVTVTDAKGCNKSMNVNLPSQPEILINAIVNNIACRGTTTGSIDITLSGGTGSGFTVQWTSATVNTTTEDISGLTTGNYNLSVTDIGSGCVVTRTYTITQPASVLSLSAKGTNATGCNAPGTITATGAGGTSPYQYKIDNGQYQSSGSFSGLYGGGTFTVWVKDANNCTTSKAITITDNGSDE